jgi:phosphoribosylformylglycinamidine synthase
MVGELPDAARAGRLGFAAEGHRIAIAGPFAPDLRGSELARLGGAALPTSLAEIDIALVRQAHEAVRDAVRAGELASAHDIAEGGVAVAIAECCLAGGLGAAVALGDTVKPLKVMFGEGAGGFIVSGTEAALRALGERTPLDVIGEVGGSALNIAAGEFTVELALDRLRDAHAGLATLFA